MNLVILGPQGCGKGTQAELLARKYNLRHIDMGLALREAAQENTPLGKKLDEIINLKRELVSDELVRMVFEKKLSDVPSDLGIILDGSPRRIDQIDDVEMVLEKFGRKIDKVIHINISEKESVLRISKRYNCASCKKGLILGKDMKNSSDSCHYCGGNIEQRPDDTPDGIRKRLSIFKSETLSVVEYFRKKKILIEVDGEKNSNKVFEEIVAEIAR